MQMEFDDFFKGQLFVPAPGFEPRDFQVDGLMDFVAFSKTGMLSETGKRLAWIFYGGTGSGKTKLAGLIAAHALNTKRVDQIVVVVPNRTILKKTREDFARFFGIHLVVFNKRKHSDGVPRRMNGYILTYSALIENPGLHRDICEDTSTLVIFDEIHHLGDNQDSTWGARAQEAFNKAELLIGLTGTPYRSDNNPIPFVEYFPTEGGGVFRFKANKTFTLGQAVALGYCRKPKFHFYGGKVKICLTNGNERIVDFEDKVAAEIAALRLRGAVVYGSTIRKLMLQEALEECKEAKRKVIIFLGGDTCGDSTPKIDANNYLPAELVELGYTSDDYDVVTSDDPRAQKRIDDFENHPTKWILVTINMVSEGTDIPPLSAAIFLTSITAKQTTVQRIGRILRMMENDPHADALVYMFSDGNLEDLAKEIEDEIRHEVNLKNRRDKEIDLSGGEKPQRKAEAIGIGDSQLKKVITTLKGGKVVEFPAAQIEWAKEKLREIGMPSSSEHAVTFLLGGTCKL